jgi:Ran GTPase-activating protein (RanGAP) involved in mRNA processing and transport
MSKKSTTIEQLKPYLIKFNLNDKEKIISLISTLEKHISLNLMKTYLTDQTLEMLTEILKQTNFINELNIKLTNNLNFDTISNFCEALEDSKIDQIGFYFKNLSLENFDKILNKIEFNFPYLYLRLKTDKKDKDLFITKLFGKIENNAIIKGLNLSYNTLYEKETFEKLNNLIEKLKPEKLNFNSILSKHMDNLKYPQSLKELKLSKNLLNIIDGFNISLKSLTKLNLSYNNIDRRGIKPLVTKYLIQDDCILEHLNLNVNYVGDMGCSYLSQFLAKSKTIKILKLMHNSIYDNGFGHLADGLSLNSSLEELELSDNFIREAGVSIFIDKLTKEKNESLKLKKLNLTYNAIKDEGLEKLKDFYVMYSDTIKTIQLRDNKLTDTLSFFSALEKRLFTNLKKIDLSFNTLTDNCMVNLSELLKKNQISILILDHNNIGDQGIEFLRDGFVKCPTLKYFSIGKNNLNDDGAIAIANGLIDNSTIEYLILNDNKISTEGIAQIGEFVLRKPSMKSLDLTRNLLNCGSCLSLGKHLIEAKGIQKINLSSNKIKDEGIKYIANAILHNNTLTDINLENNDITDIGMELLCEAINSKETFNLLNVASNSFSLSGIKSVAYVIPKLNYSYFSSHTICNQGLAILIEALQSNPSTTRLRIISERIGSIDNAYCLAKAFADNKTIKKYDFSYSRFDENSVKIVFPLLMNNLTITNLDLNNNLLGDEGIKQISEYLKTDVALKRLNIQSNKITAMGAFYLSEALEINTSLRDLNICNNHINTNGGNAINRSLCKNKTLERLLMGYTSLDQYIVESVEQVLLNNSNLIVYSIYGNSLGNSAIIRIIDCLKSNTTLKQVSLGANDIDDNGLINIKQLFQFNRTLRVIEFNTSKLTKISAEQIGEGLRYNNSLCTVNLVNNKIDNEGFEKLLLSLKKNRSIKDIKLLLNNIDRDEQKYIVTSNEHLTFN